MLLATLLDGALLHLFESLPEAISPPEIDVSGREVVHALVTAAAVVVVDDFSTLPKLSPAAALHIVRRGQFWLLPEN
jgi:hypothetical protein